MSKRQRNSGNGRRYTMDQIAYFDDDDDNSDEDYIPSDEEYQSDNSDGKINPHRSKREYISLPDHLKGVISEKNLNNIQFEILTSHDLEEDELIHWNREKSIFLTQHIHHDGSSDNPTRLERIFVTHISDFKDSTAGNGSSSSNHSNEEQNGSSSLKQDHDAQVRLGILCKNKSKVDMALKFFMDGQELKELETVVEKGEIITIHGSDDLRKKSRQQLFLNKYVPPSSQRQQDAPPHGTMNQASSSLSTDHEFGVIKIEVYQVEKRNVKCHNFDSDEYSSEEDKKESRVNKKTLLGKKQSNKEQKRCGMQISIRSSNIQRPRKIVKGGGSGGRKKSEVQFFKKKLLFQSSYKYRNYLGYLTELNEYNIDLSKVTNTARRRSTEENGNDSSDQSESDEESTVHSTRNVSIIKKEEEGSMVDLTEEEPPKIIETISLESDNDEEENVTATPTTHNSVTNTEYTFSETVQDVNRKTVEELITFIKINDEELHNNIRNVLREQKISGSKFMSLSSTDFYQMKLHLKDQVKILQITNKIHQNSR